MECDKTGVDIMGAEEVGSRLSGMIPKQQTTFNI